MEAIEARYYDKLEEGKTKCRLCPVNCLIKPSKQGICMIRSNIDGTLYASEYGKTVAVNIDPIEKKPLYHFMPGKDILSIGPNGCNFSCVFCQNWNISQEKSHAIYISPSDLVKLAGKDGSIGVAYTYTEPLVWFEYVYDSAKLLKDTGLFTVIVSNGYINEKPARELFKYIDAANFDLKSIRPDFYRKLCKGKLEDVQRTIGIAAEMGLHVEITNLLIPEKNDSDDDIRELIDWICDFNPSTVLHISRYFPHYKLDTPLTASERVDFAYRAAKAKLKYVYTGNITGVGDPDTKCVSCGATLIERNFYNVKVIGLHAGKCSKCGADTDIVV
jgi:pyruvate formate lyase activating enzyme